MVGQTGQRLLKARRNLGLISVVVGMALMLFGAASVVPVQAASVTPELLQGASNEGKRCGDNEGAGQHWLELKVEPPANGTYDNATFSVTISNYEDATNSFDWTASTGVDAVIVKNGVDGANLYRYDPPAERGSDTNLRTPDNGAKGISYISFCFDLEAEPTPTTSPTCTPTPTSTLTPQPTETPVPTNTSTPTSTSTLTPTATNTPTPTNTATAPAMNTATPTNTAVPTATLTASPTPTGTLTPTTEASATAAATATPSGAQEQLPAAAGCVCPCAAEQVSALPATGSGGASTTGRRMMVIGGLLSALGAAVLMVVRRSEMRARPQQR